MTRKKYPVGLRADATREYSDTVAKLKAIGFHDDADENLIVRYANELVELEECRKGVEDNGRVQTTVTGYQQKSAHQQNYEACKRNLLAMEKELKLTPYQRSKGLTHGQPKKKASKDELAAFLD